MKKGHANGQVRAIALENQAFHFAAWHQFALGLAVTLMALGITA